MAYGSLNPISNPKPMVKTHNGMGNFKKVIKSNAAAAALAATPAPSNQP